ncbi:GNAT family N-acetyltransferase [Tenacibaculum tangerinum]|uniref:GNAT family N-acetyltransferase n=1 Tax=Tenacibaculum tangerinum TaxID=3038772 RepID=A0ABY8LAI6_9FLAO|nr:GNAT family N-acetyltransferase [Tenacibaculum tangerinum]WGH77045.1 GNAT family N-acetyltransferase [Tenacibaculum tangerinum]
MNTELKFEKTNSKDENFVSLVQELDAYLSEVNGSKDDFFRQFNTIDVLPYVMVGYLGATPVACGAFKVVANKTVEVKRMYVKPTSRGKNVATLLLKELEEWVKQEGFDTIILETSKTMKSAVNLYQKNGYVVIPNYAPYKEVSSSICFQKQL